MAARAVSLPKLSLAAHSHGMKTLPAPWIEKCELDWPTPYSPQDRQEQERSSDQPSMEMAKVKTWKKNWKGLPREVVASPPLEEFNKRLGCDTQCHGLLDKVEIGQRLDPIILERSLPT